mgnify:CR=1 FL=1|jgi:hypothetical protein
MASKVKVNAIINYIDGVFQHPNEDKSGDSSAADKEGWFKSVVDYNDKQRESIDGLLNVINTIRAKKFKSNTVSD